MTSNQPIRPWFRLGSIARLNLAPAPAPPAQSPEPAPIQAPLRPIPARSATMIRPIVPPPIQPPSPPQVVAPPPPKSPPQPTMARSPLRVQPQAQAQAQPPSQSQSQVQAQPSPRKVVDSPVRTPSSPPITSRSPPRSNSSPPPSQPPITNRSSPRSLAQPSPQPYFTQPSPSRKFPSTPEQKTVQVATNTLIASPLKPKPIPSSSFTPSYTNSNPNPTSPPKQAPSYKPTFTNGPSPTQSLSQPTKPNTPPATAQPLSPLSLPPSQLSLQTQHQSKTPPPLEVEQNRVMVQKTVKPTPTDNYTKRQNGKNNKYSSDSEKEMRIITIAGENKGAIMEVTRSPYKGNPSYLYKTGTSGAETEHSGRNASHITSPNKHAITPNSVPMSAFMNSNVQGINNSIVYNSSSTHHDPGVHLTLTTKPGHGGFHVKENHLNGYRS